MGETTERGSYEIDLKGGSAGTAEGPGEPGEITIRRRGDGLQPPVTGPQYPEGTPEYAAYREELGEELGKFERGEEPYPYPDGRPPRSVATVVNGGQEVNLRDMLTEPWQPALAERLTKTLGRKYLAHQLVSMLPADVALRLVDRVDEVVERRVTEEIERIHHDVDGAVATTLARLAEEADVKRREISRERFAGPSRLS